MLQIDDLIGIRDLCLNEYTKEREDICFIILYGGAAKCFVGKKPDFDDFDINIFFKYSSKTKSTHGTPKRIDEVYKGKKVEIMRNKLKKWQSWNDLIDFIERQKSKRWKRIGTETVIGLYPREIKVIVE
jgi:hypothetical protein